MRSKYKLPFSSLLKQHRRWEKTILSAARMSRAVLGTVATPKTRMRAKSAPASRLEEVVSFGTNPGRLRMLRYVPPALPKKAPLVVVLHGCRQTAEDYDIGSGWSTLARERGFAVVYAEQTTSNNGNRCFNWFRPSSVTRDRGEVVSIRQMIAKMATQHGIDKKRVYVTGLSAGGAMTAAMLATYPDVFAGGGIIAGLPFGAARDVRRALDAMRSAPDRSAAEWGDLVKAAAPSRNPGRVSRSGTARRTRRCRSPMPMRCCPSGCICTGSTKPRSRKASSMVMCGVSGAMRRARSGSNSTRSRAWGTERRSNPARPRDRKQIRPDRSCSMPEFRPPCIWQRLGG
ncbi:PHB depolymerase family esterase [Rhizobium sp. 32-5/1]|uniref:extracellular catalytic domain type 1 short-chain-length polyhydroxyalkanoate depolymerase n=1 Tax=Rhizobium sp. 32-5/1 TaxID=3019602 RepID=UPI00240E2137|nr:PHB depolymerase family esterase [Rhizobium sp. 32-5/1]WEZ84183.1 PHB depolymerase family esterase [Rhizobium sp. 32-5/1]